MIRDTLLIKGILSFVFCLFYSSPIYSFWFHIKEVQDLERNLPHNCKIKFPNAHELHKIELYISPEDTYWHGGKFKFIIDVPAEYNILVS